MRLHRLNDPNWTIFKMIFIIYSIWKLSTYTWNDCMRIELNGIERNRNRYTECEWERNIEREREIETENTVFGVLGSHYKISTSDNKKMVWTGKSTLLFQHLRPTNVSMMKIEVRDGREIESNERVRFDWKYTIGPNSILDAPRSAKIPVDLT